MREHHPPASGQPGRRGLDHRAIVDPRVEPAAIVGSESGDAVVARNIGGRVTPALINGLAW